MMSTAEMIDGALERVRALATATALLDRSNGEMVTVAESLFAHQWASETLGTEAHAILALSSALRARVAEMAHSEANRLGWLVGKYQITPVARESGSEPIAWITGNSFMPPLRDFGDSETVWDLANDTLPELWERYVEGIERALDEESVLMSAPEYDNALYVVDLARFDAVTDDETGEWIEGEWRARGADAS